jgi:hypothetical protein
LEYYYRKNVVGGPNSFVKVAEKFDVFGQALLNKLITEIAGEDRSKERRFAESPTQSTELDSYPVRR